MIDRSNSGGSEWATDSAADIEAPAPAPACANPSSPFAYAKPPSTPAACSLATPAGGQAKSMMKKSSSVKALVSVVNHAAKIPTKLQEQHDRQFDDTVFDEARRDPDWEKDPCLLFSTCVS